MERAVALLQRLGERQVTERAVGAAAHRAWQAIVKHNRQDLLTMSVRMDCDGWLER